MDILEVKLPGWPEIVAHRGGVSRFVSGCPQHRLHVAALCTSSMNSTGDLSNPLSKAATRLRSSISSTHLKLCNFCKVTLNLTGNITLVQIVGLRQWYHY